jgi:hypothetical protein
VGFVLPNKKRLVIVTVMVFNATFNNISLIAWRSVLLVEETGEKPPTCHKSLTIFNHILLYGVQTHDVIGDRH